MYNILTLNKISPVGLDKLPASRFNVGDNIENPDGIILRSYSMHEMELPKSLLAIARAGAGTNNIPVNKCAEEGIVVFNSPGANANAVKELVLCALLFSSRKVINGIEWVKTLKGQDDADKQVEKGKSQFIGPEIMGKTLGVIGLGNTGGRVAIARKVRAHLLVSIHADAWVKASARGSSVFALSQRGASSSAARWLAKSQNESDLIGGVNIATVDKTVASVLVDMTSNWTISYSLALGAAVLHELKSINRLHKNKVEQAGFAVLKGQGIPSILVETAFISNPQEENLLRNGNHQQKLARAILTGIKKQLAADPTLLRG